MDFSSLFSTSTLRFVSLYLVPSAWAALPLYILLTKIDVRRHLEINNEFLFGVFAVSFLIGFGFIIENLATAIEEKNDDEIEKNDSEFKDKWHRYLLTAINEQAPIKDYIRTLVVRLKFENSFVVATKIHVGSALACVFFCPENAAIGLAAWAFYTLILVTLIHFLREESTKSSRLLYELRNSILADKAANG